MGNVVRFPTREPYVTPAQANQDVVATIKRMLHEAESGYLVGAALVLLYSDGRCQTGWQKPDGSLSSDRMQAGIATLAHRYNAATT